MFYFYIIFAENGAYDFTEKLEIWTPIIKGLTMHAKLNRYNDIIHQLVSEIMRRTQFEFNKTELELLDNELMEDNVSFDCHLHDILVGRDICIKYYIPIQLTLVG